MLSIANAENGEMMQEYTYTIFFEPAEEGGYVVHVPAIPEILHRRRYARTMSEDAIRCVIESNIRRGEPVPKDVAIQHEPIKEKLAIKYAA